MFQKKVLSILVDIRHRLKETQPASSAVHIERIETMEDFELKEQHLSDAQAFNTLVGFTSLEVMDSTGQHHQPNSALKAMYDA